MKARYTEQQIDFIREGFLLMKIPELTIKFNAEFGSNKTIHAIKTAVTSRGFTCGRKGGFEKGDYKLLNKMQTAYIVEKYKLLSVIELTKELNEKFNISLRVNQIRTFVHNHGIESGRTGCFKKGCVPANKGTKGLTRANVASFKKGDIPQNIRPVGSERFDTKDGSILIKINKPNPYTNAKTRWVHKHVYVWEQAYGPKPKNMVVHFKDGDNKKCDLSNLELITRAELLYLNQHRFRDLPNDLKPEMRALAKLEATRFKMEKDIHD